MYPFHDTPLKSQTKYNFLYNIYLVYEKIIIIKTRLLVIHNEAAGIRLWLLLHFGNNLRPLTG